MKWFQVLWSWRNVSSTAQIRNPYIPIVGLAPTCSSTLLKSHNSASSAAATQSYPGMPPNRALHVCPCYLFPWDEHDERREQPLGDTSPNSDVAVAGKQLHLCHPKSHHVNRKRAEKSSPNLSVWYQYARKQQTPLLFSVTSNYV